MMNWKLWKRRAVITFCQFVLLTAYLSGWTIQAGRLSDGFAEHLMVAALLIVGLVEWRAARFATQHAGASPREEEEQRKPSVVTGAAASAAVRK